MRARNVIPGLGLCVSAVLALAAGPAETGEACRLISPDGAPLSVVVCPEAAPDVRRSAEALAAYLEKITGASFPVTTGNGSTGLAVGMREDFPELKDAVTGNLLKQLEGSDLTTLQSYLLCSHGKGAHIIGASELAVRYAVWDFLYQLGYRQFFPGPTWEVIPKAPDATATVEKVERPDYFDRRIFYGYGARGPGHMEWVTRNRMNYNRSVKHVGWDTTLPKKWQTVLINAQHIYPSIIAANKAVFTEHPEYYGLESGCGKRIFTSQLCIANPEVRRLAVEYALGQLEKYPFLSSVSMEPADGNRWCECDDCKALGRISDRVVLLANTVVEALVGKYPDTYVGILAYNKHAKPPTIDVHPKVVVSVATAFSSYPAPALLKAWNQKASTLGIREYYAIYSWHHALPNKMSGGNPKYIARTIPKFHELGAKALVTEAGNCWGPCGLGFYVTSRLLWNVEAAKDLDGIIDDFCDKAFGPGAKPMKAFYAYISKATARPRRGEPPGFFLERVPEMYCMLAEARRLVDADAAIVARLNDLTLYTRWVELWAKSRAAPAKLKALARYDFAVHAHRMRDTNMAHHYAARRVEAFSKIDIAADRQDILPPDAPASERVDILADDDLGDLDLTLDKPKTPLFKTPFSQAEIDAILAAGMKQADVQD